MAAAGLELQGVRTSFGTLVAVNDLETAVRPGEVFGFVGKWSRERPDVFMEAY